jgi:hypothetical protein
VSRWERCEACGQRYDADPPIEEGDLVDGEHRCGDEEDES